MSEATASAIALLKALLKFTAHNSMFGGVSREQKPFESRTARNGQASIAQIARAHFGVVKDVSVRNLATE